MSMRKSTRQELRKLREVLRYALRKKNCYFCHKPLIDTKSYAKDGDGQGSPVRNITVHHKNGNHDDDREKNKALCHDKPCHRSHHAKLRAKARKENHDVENSESEN